MYVDTDAPTSAMRQQDALGDPFAAVGAVASLLPGGQFIAPVTDIVGSVLHALGGGGAGLTDSQAKIDGWYQDGLNGDPGAAPLLLAMAGKSGDVHVLEHGTNWHASGFAEQVERDYAYQKYQDLVSMAESGQAAITPDAIAHATMSSTLAGLTGGGISPMLLALLLGGGLLVTVLQQRRS